jgi:hypothetical protein
MSEWGDYQSESVGLASFRLSPSRQVFALAPNIQQQLKCAAPSNRVALGWFGSITLHVHVCVCVWRRHATDVKYHTMELLKMAATTAVFPRLKNWLSLVSNPRVPNEGFARNFIVCLSGRAPNEQEQGPKRAVLSLLMYHNIAGLRARL